MAATPPTCRSPICAGTRRSSPTNTTARRWPPSTAARRGCWSRTCTSGNRRNGCAGCASWPPTSPASGRRTGTTSTAIPGRNSGTTVTEAAAAAPPGARPRLTWQQAEVLEVVTETARARSLVLRVPDWPGHLPGQHVDLRLTAEDGYQVERSYSIASPPERPEVVLTVERIDRGEVSPFLTEEA